MSSPQKKIGIAAAIIVLLTAGVVVLAMMQQADVSCEVCITFHGRRACRTALGPDRESALRTAIDNACGQISGGMTDSISCSNTRPDSITCSTD